MFVGCDRFDNLLRSCRRGRSDQIHDVDHSAHLPEASGLIPQHGWFRQMVQKVFREDTIEAALSQRQAWDMSLQWGYPAFMAGAAHRSTCELNHPRRPIDRRNPNVRTGIGKPQHRIAGTAADVDDV